MIRLATRNNCQYTYSIQLKGVIECSTAPGNLCSFLYFCDTLFCFILTPLERRPQKINGRGPQKTKTKNGRQPLKK